MEPTPQDLENITLQLHQLFPMLGRERLSETLVKLYEESTHDEFCRIEILEEPFGAGTIKRLGIAFFVGVLPTDAIYFFDRARLYFRNLQLLYTYYPGQDGKFYTNGDAWTHWEADREEETRSKIMAHIREVQIEEYEIQRLEREGRMKKH